LLVSTAATLDRTQLPWWREPTGGQWISFLAAWFGWVLDAFDFTIFLLVMPQIAGEFHVTVTATAWTITLTLMLRLVGGVAAGWAADKWGRKTPLMISVLWFAACDGAIAFAPSFAVVFALRTLFGLGMGAEWASGTTLAMENWPKRSRGIASGMLQGSWAIGYLLASLIGSAMLQHGFGWRSLFIVAAIPAVLVLPIRIFVPESLPTEAQKAESKAAAQAEAEAPGARNLGATVGWACFYTALAFAAYYAISSLYPTFLKTELHLTPAEWGPLISWYNVGMMVGSLACGYLAARWSPVGAIMLCSVLILPTLPLYVGWVPGGLTAGAFLGGVFGAGFCGVTPLLLTSMFPAHVRARSIGFVYHVGACFAAFAPPLTSTLHDSYGFTYAKAILLATGGFHVVLGLALVLRPRGLFDAAKGSDVAADAPLVEA
jgi:SHS family lactate transporter-like MFS transporter